MSGQEAAAACKSRHGQPKLCVCGIDTLRPPLAPSPRGRDAWFQDLPAAIEAGAAALGLDTGVTLPVKDLRLPACALTARIARTVVRVMPQLNHVVLHNGEEASDGAADAAAVEADLQCYGAALTALLQPSGGSGLANLSSMSLGRVPVRGTGGCGSLGSRP